MAVSTNKLTRQQGVISRWLDEKLAKATRNQVLSSEESKLGFSAKQSTLAEDRTSLQTHEDVVVRDFTQATYNGMRTHDFLERANLLFDAALNVAKRRAMPLQITQLNQVRQAYLQAIKARCGLDSKLMSDYVNVKTSDEHEQAKRIALAHFSSQFTRFSALLKEAVVDCAQLLVRKDESSLNAIVEEIQKQEHQVVVERGRPSSIHKLQLNGEIFLCAHEPVGRYTLEQQVHLSSTNTLVSPHTQDGSYTLPSTCRDREGLCNFVQTSFSVESKAGHETLFAAYRNSSFSPILIRDRVQRNAITARTMRQFIDTLARRNLQPGRSEITLNITALSLMSTSFLESQILRRGEDEAQQIRDTARAMRLYDGRTIKRVIDGREVSITVNTNMMTVGSNPTRNYFSFGHRLQTEFNRRGYVTHLARLTHTLTELQADIPAAHFSDDLQRFHNQLKRLQDDPKVKGLMRKITDMKGLLGELHEEREALLLRDPLPSASEYKQHQAKITRLENALDKLYRKVHSRQKSLWKDSHYDKNIEPLITELQRLKNDAKLAAPVKKNLRRFMLLIQLAYESQKLYYPNTGFLQNKRFRKEKYMYSLQKNLTEAAYLMGDDLTFFCKSGEDRTGTLDDLVQEDMAFMHQHGYLPRYKSVEDNRTVRELYTAALHQFGMSTQCTAENAPGSRGKQVFAKQAVHERTFAPMDQFREVARTAKGPFSILSQLKFFKRTLTANSSNLSERAQAALTQTPAAPLPLQADRLTPELPTPQARVRQQENELAQLHSLLQSHGGTSKAAHPINITKLIQHLKQAQSVSLTLLSQNPLLCLTKVVNIGLTSLGFKRFFDSTDKELALINSVLAGMSQLSQTPGSATTTKQLAILQQFISQTPTGRLVLGLEMAQKHANTMARNAVAFVNKLPEPASQSEAAEMIDTLLIRTTMLAYAQKLVHHYVTALIPYTSPVATLAVSAALNYSLVRDITKTLVATITELTHKAASMAGVATPKAGLADLSLFTTAKGARVTADKPANIGATPSSPAHEQTPALRAR